MFQLGLPTLRPRQERVHITGRAPEGLAPDEDQDEPDRVRADAQPGRHRQGRADQLQGVRRHDDL